MKWFPNFGGQRSSRKKCHLLGRCPYRKPSHSMATYAWVTTPARGTADEETTMIVEAIKENQEEWRL